jgi:hypothetical protein
VRTGINVAERSERDVALAAAAAKHVGFRVVE